MSYICVASLPNIGLRTRSLRKVATVWASFFYISIIYIQLVMQAIKAATVFNNEMPAIICLSTFKASKNNIQCFIIVHSLKFANS